MIKRLPTFRGYTVDYRLKQFRKIDWKKPIIKFIEFDSKKGRKILKQMKKEGYNKKLKEMI